jgi:hypothetical protein
MAPPEQRKVRASTCPPLRYYRLSAGAQQADRDLPSNEGKLSAARTLGTDWRSALYAVSLFMQRIHYEDYPGQVRDTLPAAG